MVGRTALSSWSIAVLGAIASTCGGPAESSPEPVAAPGECLLLRTNASSVIGMDVGSSVSLGGGRSMFLFGDTFFGGFHADGSRRIDGAVHSSTAVVDDAAIASCFAGTAFAMDHGALTSYLVPTQDEAWPLGPALFSNGAIDVAYTWVQSSTSDALGFVTLGNGIVVAPSGASTLPVDVHALSAPATEAMPAAWVVRGGQAYLFRCGTQLGAGWDPCVVGRIDVANAANLGAYQYFVAGQGYVGTYAQATIVTEGAPAFSVTFNAYANAFVEVYVEPFGPAVYARTAAAPEGPFSDKVALWPCSLPADDPHAYCYAGFEHPQFDAPDGRHIVLTYSTNSTDFGAMARHPNVYWPRLTTVDLTRIALPAAP